MLYTAMGNREPSVAGLVYAIRRLCPIMIIVLRGAINSVQCGTLLMAGAVDVYMRLQVMSGSHVVTFISQGSNEDS